MKVVKVVKILLFLAPLTISGCWAASTLIGTPVQIGVQAYVTWKNGEAFKYYPYSKEVMSRAVQRAFTRMQLTVVGVIPTSSDGCTFIVKWWDKTTGYGILAGNNNQFNVNIEQKEQNVCVVRCRVDFWGDKEYAELLYKYIDEEVNTIEFTNGGSIKSQF